MHHYWQLFSPYCPESIQNPSSNHIRALNSIPASSGVCAHQTLACKLIPSARYIAQSMDSHWGDNNRQHTDNTHTTNATLTLPYCL